ncbi:MAG TPA: hypothetical protein VK452_05320 [Dissulfurispiraceae bacterium]|nr:hypothetical protein [Dissulfurispiraceae bacterium]
MRLVLVGSVTLMLLVMGCVCNPIVPYNLETPPSILIPANLAAVKDERSRFREIYCAIQADHGRSLPEDKPCDEVILRLGNESSPTGKTVRVGPSAGLRNMRIVVVPGIFSECVAGSVRTYSDAIDHLKKIGYKIDLLQVAGRSGSSQNAKQIRDFIVSKVQLEERLILVGYSKGVPDILEAVVDYADLQDRVVAIVSIAGVVSGTPVVEAIAENYQKLIEEIHATDCPPHDKGALDSLKPSRRMKWLAENILPQKIKYFSLVALGMPNEISAILIPSYRLLSRVDPRNDSQVIFYNAIIPGSVLMGYVKADHWAIAMPFSRETPLLASTLINYNSFPREILLESVLKFVEESLEVDLAASH